MLLIKPLFKQLKIKTEKLWKNAGLNISREKTLYFAHCATNVDYFLYILATGPQGLRHTFLGLAPVLLNDVYNFIVRPYLRSR